VTEGVGRRLNPRVNMWSMARPLIESWMREHRGPEARIREAVRHGFETLEKLPQLMSRLDESVAALARAEGAAPSPRRYAHPPPPRRTAPTWPLWTAIGLLAVAVFVLAAF